MTVGQRRAQSSTTAELPREGSAERAPRTAEHLALLAGLNGSTQREASRWLGSSGFDVVTADNVAHALETLEDLRPDLVLVDAALRDESGRSLCEVLRHEPALADRPRAESARLGEAVVLVLCSNRREALAALQAGATDLIERPLDGQLAASRACRLVRQRATTIELGRLREELDGLRRTLEDERRERAWREHTDALTGLPDGGRLEQALETALTSATQESVVAVALFDVAHLIKLNSRIGRARANSVLQQVAQRLVAGLRSEQGQRAAVGPSLSMAARVAGGLFAVVLTGLPGWPEVRAAVRSLLDGLSGRYSTGGEEVLLTVSVGVALAPADGQTAEVLMQRAELAVKEASQNGGAIRFYGESGYRTTERGRAIARLLPIALSRGDFQLHYQPLVEGADARICSAEGLLRWECPELGTVSPAEFIPLAEEAGLMVSLGRWVLRTACRQIRAWCDEGLPPTRIAVNVSLCQLARGDLAQIVRESLDEAGVDASLLELELSERGALRADPEIIQQLEAIHDLGVRLALDDFGTGNSAVAYLKRFPIDVLKIDQSYVQGVATSAEDAAIAGATIAMARRLGLRVVAEGVEKPGQVKFLRRHGCSVYQGFLFSPAVPAEAFAALLREASQATAGPRPVSSESGARASCD